MTRTRGACRGSGHWGYAARVVLGACLLARSVAAQTPASDPDTEKRLGAKLVGQVTEWYLTARTWRDWTMAKSNQMLSQTRKLTALRQQYESMAEGELGVLGGAVPDWRKFSNACAVGAGGVTLCNVGSYTSASFERILESSFTPIRDSLFALTDSVDTRLRDLAALPAGSAADLRRQYATSPARNTVQTHDLARAQLQQGMQLDLMARHLNLLLDSLALEEATGKPLSSGRAAQLSAHLALLEARSSLEIAESQVRGMELSAARAANNVHALRQSRQQEVMLYGR